jgi:cell division protease FtsH
MNANLRKLISRLIIWAVIPLLIVLAVVTEWLSPAERSVSQDIAFSQLLRDVDQGRVREVIIKDHEIRGTYRDGRGFSTYAPNDPSLVQRLYSKDVVITASSADAPWLFSLLVSWLPFVALIGVWIYLSRQLRSASWRRGTISARLLEDPKYGHERADEARAVAEKLADPESKRRMLEIADSYEHLALRAEERLRDSEKSE